MKKTFALVLACLLTSCGYFDHGVFWSSGPYSVISTDGVVRLVYAINDEGGSIGRVSEQVLAVGINQKYVTAKQESEGKEMYFYIERAQDTMYKNGDEVTRGPFDFNQFTELKNNLGLPEFSWP